MKRYGYGAHEMGEDSVSTGSAALDAILSGGYAQRYMHLIEGRPGSGKTTLAPQFLLAGRDAGERCLYLTLSESVAEIADTARVQGFSLDCIDFCELVPPEMSLNPALEQSVVYASDLELGETVSLVMAAVETYRPSRIVFDSLSEIRLLAQHSLIFRRRVLALKHFFAQAGCTVLMLDDLTDLLCAIVSLPELLDGIRVARFAAAILTEEALPGASALSVAKDIAKQPPWSDFPFVVLTRRDRASPNNPVLHALRNVTEVERPVHPATLLGTVRSALRARDRQRETASHLMARQAAEAELRSLAQALKSAGGRTHSRTSRGQ